MLWTNKEHTFVDEKNERLRIIKIGFRSYQGYEKEKYIFPCEVDSCFSCLIRNSRVGKSISTPIDALPVREVYPLF